MVRKCLIDRGLAGPSLCLVQWPALSSKQLTSKVVIVYDEGDRFLLEYVGTPAWKVRATIARIHLADIFYGSRM